MGYSYIGIEERRQIARLCGNDGLGRGHGDRLCNGLPQGKRRADAV